MEKLYFVVDIDRCWGCKSCQVACKREHGYTPEDGRPIEVVRVETGEGETLRCDFIPALCLHCEEPACAPVCPKNAIEKGKDGLVRINADACIGCGKCVGACAFGAMQLAGTGREKKAIKCDLCTERRARGFLTSCEQHCMGEAFHSCGEEEARGLLEHRRYHWSAGQVLYVSDVLSELGKRL